MEKILLKCQHKNHDVNKKKQCLNFWSNFWSNFRPFSTKLDHFDETIIRRSGSFDEMVLGNVALSTKWH